MANAVEQIQNTHEFLIAAVQAGDWQQVGELDRLCRTQVQQAMQDPQRDDQQIAEVLEGLSGTYREVVALCQAVQGKLAEELQDLQKSRQGAKVYQMFT
ncbi:MAG TPA: flagellar protein FliT [Pseudomonas sabulinigri]|jgi:flagellar protein FliT|uniref:Flagellar protein FliT n=1 Tax=marine sediment metagenome TaxID=412755 RepID=A0A0F9XUK2_9ZZZZ|nr:flagellar protein FliT [Halopseudomonas sabulinigri]HEC52947.1 flagellar protein FliT [Halopseudomonas sabulinigri]|tara:strand:- start:4483 stop:4779 length:297 start_codon:yes stop_codon:yes gene_type:complete